MSHTGGRPDDDALAVRRASRRVGVQLAVVAAGLVILATSASIVFVLAHVEGDRDARGGAVADIGVGDVLAAGAVIGGGAIAIAGSISWYVTRRAVRPLAHALRLQRTFVADAAHELRTPIAVLDSRLQQLQRALPERDPAHASLAELRADTANLGAIVGDLLDDADPAQLRSTEPRSAVTAVELALESMRVVAADRDIHFDLSIQAAPWIRVPDGTLHRAVVSLLDNAVRYSPDGTVVEVGLRQVDHTAVISVRDHGAGITGVEPHRVFERFVRGDASAYDPRGSGIGLALVRQTLAAHGGEVGVESSGPGGTEMRLTVPAFREPSATARDRRS